MPKTIRSMVLSIIVLVAIGSTAYFLNQLDQIVHGQLYNYHLEFSLEWANPYWNILRIIQTLLGVAGAATGISLVFSIKKEILSKKSTEKVTLTQRPQKGIPQVPAVHRAVDRQTVSPPSQRTAGLSAPITKPAISPSQPAPITPVAPTGPTPTPQQFSSEIPGPIRCPHCGRAFTQPLRMLDFQGDRPRIINICPFCNEIIQTRPKHESEEDEQLLLRRKNNHTSRTVPSQPTG